MQQSLMPTRHTTLINQVWLPHHRGSRLIRAWLDRESEVSMLRRSVPERQQEHETADTTLLPEGFGNTFPTPVTPAAIARAFLTATHDAAEPDPKWHDVTYDLGQPHATEHDDAHDKTQDLDQPPHDLDQPHETEPDANDDDN